MCRPNFNELINYKMVPAGLVPATSGADEKIAIELGHWVLSACCLPVVPVVSLLCSHLNLQLHNSKEATRSQVGLLGCLRSNITMQKLRVGAVLA